MTKQDALVSVIVPVYGTEEYLPDCLDSILRQSYPNMQILLVDDQSPDRCPEICDAYARKDARITVIHQENKGVSGARNTGMRHATGDYIMFVDSDDELCTDAVERLLQDAIEYGADVASATYRMIDENGDTICVHEDGDRTVLQDESPLLLSLAGAQSTDAVWAKLFKSAFIKDLYFEEGKNIHEDGFFIFQCYMKKPILVQHNVAVYRYYIRKSSCSRQTFSDKYLSMLYFCERKKEVLVTCYPQYIDQVYNMEVRTCLQLLDLLCSSTGKKYKKLQRACVKTVRRSYAYHSPINEHHKKLAWVVVHGLYPLYKLAVGIKYHR